MTKHRRNSMETDKAQKAKSLNLVDSAIIALIASAALLYLSFSFNCGYNYYYGIPLMFASTNWFALAYRIPQMGDVIFLITIAVLLVTFVINLIKLFRKPKDRNKYSDVHVVLVWVIIAIIVLIVIMIFATIRFQTIVFYVVDFMLLLFLIYFSIVYFKEKKLAKLYKKILQPDSAVTSNTGIENELDNEKNHSEFYHHSEQTIKLLDAYPKNKTFFISIAFSLISLIFIAFFAYGLFTAYNKTSYCFIDENWIVVNTVETNAIVMNVEYNSDTKEYENQFKFQIIPQENLKFYILNCGRVKSPQKVEEQAWSIGKLKLN